MADVTVVPRQLTLQDIMPNYDYQLQGYEIDYESSANQRGYLTAFLSENIDMIADNTKGMNKEQIEAFIAGAKQMLAMANLWIDTLNIIDTSTDIT